MTRRDEITRLRGLIERLERARQLYLGDRARLRSHEERTTWIAELTHRDLSFPVVIGARDLLTTITTNLQAAKDMLADLDNGR